MKQQLKYISIGTALGVSLMFSAQIFAEEAPVAGAISNAPFFKAVAAAFNFKVNGTDKVPSESPVVIDGNSYLPVRSIANMLGYDVTYKADSRTIEFNGTAQVSQGQTQGQEMQPQTSVNSKKNIGEGIIYYNASDVNARYLPVKLKNLENGHTIWIMQNGIEIDQQKIMSEKDAFYVPETNATYWSRDYFLHYLTDDQLKEFQKYKIDFSTKIVTPIN